MNKYELIITPNAKRQIIEIASDTSGEGETLPDDNIAQYGSDEDPADGGDA